MSISSFYDKWEKISNEAFNSLVEESAYNIDANLALNMRIDGDKIYTNYYIIECIKYSIYDVEKYYYNIYDSQTNELIYKDICLFITVKIIIHSKIKNKSVSDYLLVLDTKYGSLLSNTIFYKNKLYKMNDNKSTYMAKYDGCLMNLSRIRSQIENFDK